MLPQIRTTGQVDPEAVRRQVEDSVNVRERKDLPVRRGDAGRTVHHPYQQTGGVGGRQGRYPVSRIVRIAVSVPAEGSTAASRRTAMFTRTPVTAISESCSFPLSSARRLG